MNDKITLSLRDVTLKDSIKKYASENGITVSAIVENYFKELIGANKSKKQYPLPNDLDQLLDGIVIKKEAREKPYKKLREEMINEKFKY